MIHSNGVLLFVLAQLRQAADDYEYGRNKIEKWKIKYYQGFRGDLRKKMERYWLAEEFWFDKTEGGEEWIDLFWEQYHLDWIGWNSEYFRRMVKEGRFNEITKVLGVEHVGNTRAKQVVKQEVLEHSWDWERRGDCRSGTGGVDGAGGGADVMAGQKPVERGCECYI
jgi:hypothetical protein